MNPVLKRLRFRRFSTVQLLVALVLSWSRPLLLKNSKAAVSLYRFVFVGPAAAVFAVADRKRTLAIALAIRTLTSRV